MIDSRPVGNWITPQWVNFFDKNIELISFSVTSQSRGKNHVVNE